MKQLKIIWHFFLAQLQETGEYRGMIIIWMFESFFFPMTVLFVWISISSSSFDIHQQLQHIINYYSLLPLVSVLTGAWHGIFLAQEIRLGKFNKYLTRPVFPLAYSISNNLAEKVIKFFFILPFILVSHLLFGINLYLTPVTALLFPLTILLSTATSFLIDTIIGLMSFWMDEVTSLENLSDIALYTLGGKLAPIFLFPSTFQKIANLLPLRYMFSFPLEVITGALTPNQILFGLVTQFAWIVILIIATNFLWQSGVKKYSAVGG
jgi:ABC-2 type transport system permease protein